MLPRKLEWYCMDIGDTWAEVLTFLCYFLEDSFREIVMNLLGKFWDSNQMKLRFLPYSWDVAIGARVKQLATKGSTINRRQTFASSLETSLDDHIIMEGWLAKEDRKGKNWRKRYFVLTENVLSYYDSNKRYDGSLRGAFTLAGTLLTKSR